MPYVCEHAAGTRWFVKRTYHGALRPKDVAKSEAVRLGHEALLCMNDGCSPDRKYGSYPTWDDARRLVSAFYDHQARHAFEIIRHGRPCKPYGDIETKTAPFPAVPDVVRGFNEAILRIFDEDYGSPITADDILWTHSPRADKLSLHFVVCTKSPQLLFRTNGADGDPQGAKLLVERIAELRPELARFIDFGVYDKDRPMRLPGATKSAHDPSVLAPVNADGSLVHLMK